MLASVIPGLSDYHLLAYIALGAIVFWLSLRLWVVKDKLKDRTYQRELTIGNFNDVCHQVLQLQVRLDKLQKERDELYNESAKKKAADAIESDWGPMAPCTGEHIPAEPQGNYLDPSTRDFEIVQAALERYADYMTEFGFKESGENRKTVHVTANQSRAFARQLVVRNGGFYIEQRLPEENP